MLIKGSFKVLAPTFWRQRSGYINPAIEHSQQFVIPAKAGIQKKPGCRIKSGMTKLSTFNRQINKQVQQSKPVFLN
jgi:hypothetical protein